MGQEPDREYAEMKEFLSFFADRYLSSEGLPPEKPPMAILEALEKNSNKTASKGLRQAINDCIEMSFHLGHEEVAQLDEQLGKSGIVTLSELRRRYSKAYANIRTQGEIKNDVDYYLIRNIVGDPSPKTVQERELLENLIANYEGT